jgi:hypothetical protein
MSFLREPANIQISRVSSNFVFPWGLVYDIPLQPLDSEKHKICKIVDLWQDGEALPVEGVYSCPHSEEHELNTICPFGFWGMRHVIEQPPSAGKADDLVSNPLVFVNGCHTAELTPEGLVNFVDTFAGLYSSGVIGTEVTVHQLLANEAGTAFLRRFVEDATVGEALCEMRTHLLSKGNLMGLAYTAYCLAGLRLADAANTSDAEQR